MICESCRERRHGECRGGSWCDCQHQPGPAASADAPPETGLETGDETGTDLGTGGEPPVNWRRQG
ncbi:MAG: hypothetical protein ACRDNL_15190 [Spirillospora sp.]